VRVNRSALDPRGSPRVGRRVVTAAAFTIALAFAVPVAAQEAHLLVITGVEGDAEHGEQFHKWASALVDTAKTKGGVPEASITYLADKVERDPARIRGRSTRENVEKAFADLAERARPSDEVFVVLFGHGSFDGRQAAFNLPGPDLTVPDYARLLDKIRSSRIVFVNTASSSGEFVKGLAAPGRIIVTATKTGGERNEPRFPPYFVEAFTGEGADRDRNGRISVQEAFDYARAKVQQAFEKEGYILSEHATLDDSGTGMAATLFLESDRARSSAATSTSDPTLRAALEEKRNLEDQVAGLRLRKPSMPAEQYEQELEKLLTALAQKSRAIQQLEGKK
jgi:NAD(P)-dependent dehydrogenase (short-subunit alcohol dehydrogenase family)